MRRYNIEENAGKEIELARHRLNYNMIGATSALLSFMEISKYVASGITENITSIGLMVYGIYVAIIMMLHKVWYFISYPTKIGFTKDAMVIYIGAIKADIKLNEILIDDRIIPNDTEVYKYNVEDPVQAKLKIGDTHFHFVFERSELDKLKESP